MIESDTIPALWTSISEEKHSCKKITPFQWVWWTLSWWHAFATMVTIVQLEYVKTLEMQYVVSLFSS